MGRGAVVLKSYYTSLLRKDPTRNTKHDFPKKTASAAFQTAEFANHFTFSVLKSKPDLIKSCTDFHFGETSLILVPLALPQPPLFWANLKVHLDFLES